jgi:hypothetical protein
MNLPAEQKPPRYVTCRCQHCDGHIEFDANEFTEDNSIVPCPHCGLETKIFIPTGQTEKVLTEPPSSVVNSNAVRREGFFCGGGEPIIAQVSAEQPATEGRSERHPLGNAPELTEDQIKLVGERQNDGMAVKLYHEGDQDMAMSLDDARRYIADPRFKLINPETGLRFTPATLEAFIKAKRLQNKNEAAMSKEPQTQIPIPEAEQNPIANSVIETPASYKDKRMEFAKGTRFVLTTEQCLLPIVQELIDLLIEITRDGLVSKEGVQRLNIWLAGKSELDIPAINYLSASLDRFGEFTTSKAFHVQFAIERILPKTIREAIKRTRQAICKKATEAQLDYIRVLGGTPPFGLKCSEAHLLIEELLANSSPPSMQPATEKQIHFIRELGENPPTGLTKSAASSLIEELLAKQRELQARQELPTPRQIMVLRFWNKMDLAQSSKWEVEQWLTQFYDEDPHRRAAWETFKLENGDDGSQRDPSWVMLGAGERYLNKTD